MNTIEHLNSRFRQIGYEPKSGGIAFNLLTQSLKTNEVVLYLLEGSVLNSVGYLIATNSRIFYVGIDKYMKPALEHIHYEDIVSIENFDSLLPSIDLLIQAKDGRQMKIKGCEPKDGYKFVKLIRYLSQVA